MLPKPLAVPVPETDTDVVTLEVGVLAVLVALADCAIALLAVSIRPSGNRAIECEIFIDQPLRVRRGILSPYARSSDVSNDIPCGSFDKLEFARKSPCHIGAAILELQNESVENFCNQNCL
jgi:hypothetical protein